MAGNGPLSGTRRFVLIASLVCGAFGIGVSEFLVMGLLPQVARDLAPELYESAPEAALAIAGGMVTSYALGVVVGTIATPALARRMPERAVLILCAASMMLWTVLTSLSPNLEIAVALRFLAALTHATYTGLASVVVARLLGPRYEGRGNAIVIGGLTMANLFGVPILTALGSGGEWRLMLGMCSLLFALPAIVLLLIAPPSPRRNVQPSRTISVRSPARVLMLIGTITLVTGGGFTILTFAAPVTQWAQGEPRAVPVAVFMLIFGVGMNVGNFVGGWAADRSAGLTVLITGVLGAAGAVLLFIPFESAAVAGVGIFIMGIVLSGTNPGSLVLYLRELPHRPRLAVSMASGTANLGSVAGSICGGIALAGYGPQAVPFVGFVLIVLGLAAFGSRAVMLLVGARAHQQGASETNYS